MAGGAAVAAGLGAAVVVALRKYPRRGPTVIRVAFAIIVGVGAYWQEKLRQRELAEALLASGYMDSTNRNSERAVS